MNKKLKTINLTTGYNPKVHNEYLESHVKERNLDDGWVTVDNIRSALFPESESIQEFKVEVTTLVWIFVVFIAGAWLLNFVVS